MKSDRISYKDANIKSIEDYINWYEKNKLDYKSGYDDKHWKAKSIKDIENSNEANCYEKAMYFLNSTKYLKSKKIIKDYSIYLISNISNKLAPKNSYHIITILHTDIGYNSIYGIRKNKPYRHTEMDRLRDSVYNGNDNNYGFVAVRLNDSDLVSGLSMQEIHDMYKSRRIILSSSETLKEANIMDINNKIKSMWLTETLIFSGDDIILNLDDWKKENGKNVLYVVGTSGSGKSTIAREYAKKNKATIFELDTLIHRIMKYKPMDPRETLPFEKELRKFHTGEWKGITDESFPNSFKKLFEHVITLLNSDSKTRYVVEGTWLLYYYDPSYLEDKPLIIKNTSKLRSFYQGVKRDGIKQALKYFKNKYFTGIDTWLDYYNEQTESVWLTEDIFFNKDDVVKNLDKWGKGKNNILYITGLSGSGKSTIAKKYAKKNNAKLFGLDDLELMYDIDAHNNPYNKINVMFYDKIIKRYPIAEMPLDDRFWEKLLQMVSYIEELMHQDSDTLYVMEGIQIYEIYESGYFLDKPIIIKGTSMIKSLYRRYKRDGRLYGGNGFIRFAKWYYKDSNILDKLRNNIKNINENIEKLWIN